MKHVVVNVDGELIAGRTACLSHISRWRECKRIRMITVFLGNHRSIQVPRKDVKLLRNTKEEIQAAFPELFI